MRMAVIYARVSSEQQREEKTIASQTASLIEFAKSHDLEVPAERVFEDEGFSGATLERPDLERVRDLAAEGQIQVVLAYSPDRLSRKYAYQILLMEEFARQGTAALANFHPYRWVEAPCTTLPLPAAICSISGSGSMASFLGSSESTRVEPPCL